MDLIEGFELIRLTIPGEPLRKQRERISWRTGKTYTPAKTVKYKTLIKGLFAATYPNHVPWTGAVRMRVSAYYEMPRLFVSKKRRAEMEKERVWYSEYPLGRDQLWGVVADALNGIAFIDDGQVVRDEDGVERFYSPRPRVEIELRGKRSA